MAPSRDNRAVYRGPGTLKGPASHPRLPVPLHFDGPRPHRRVHHTIVVWRREIALRRNYEWTSVDIPRYQHAYAKMTEQSEELLQDFFKVA